MNLIQRFTRDEASKYVWSLLMFGAIAGLVFALVVGGNAVDRERLESQTRAVNHVARIIDPRLDGADLRDPLVGATEQAMEGAVRRSILTDDRVERVRIWASGGRLLFSTDRADDVGSPAALNDGLLRRASDGPVTVQDASDTGGADDPERSLLRTYVPVGSSAVAEVDQSDEGTIAGVRFQWLSYQILAGGLAALFLLFTVLALRDPVEKINTGVPFATSSIPKGYSLIDDERLHAVHEVYRLAAARVERLQEKLAGSEDARRRLEGDIQRALTKAATTPSRPPAARPAASAPAPPAEVVPPAVEQPDVPAPVEREVVQVPESDVVDAPLGDAWVAAPAGPLARATRDAKPPPATAGRAKPAPPQKPKRAPRRIKAKPAVKPKPVEVPAAEPQTIERPVEPVAEREVASVGARGAAAPADLDDAKAHEAALETFIRLTESDRQPHGTNELDQGAVRAALARTAARKKPGGEKLRPHDDPGEETYGGPPPERR